MSGAAPLSARAARIVRKEQTKRDIAAALDAEHVGNAELVADTGAAPQNVREWRDPEARKSLTLADARAIRSEGVRRRLAELLVPERSEVPEADAEALTRLSSFGTELLDVLLATVKGEPITPQRARELGETVRQVQRDALAVEQLLERLASVPAPVTKLRRGA